MNVLLFLSLICFLAAGIWGVIAGSWPLVLVGAGGILLIASGHPSFHL